MSDKIDRTKKAEILKIALEVAKEAARGGHRQPNIVLKDTYRNYTEIYEDIISSE